MASMLHLIYNKHTMQWAVKLGRLTVFASDNYDIAEDYILQYQADADADRLECSKERKQHEKRNNKTIFLPIRSRTCRME